MSRRAFGRPRFSPVLTPAGRHRRHLNGAVEIAILLWLMLSYMLGVLAGLAGISWP